MKRVIHSGRASLVTLIAALALTACGQEQPQEQQSQQQEAPPHPVEVTEIARRDIPLDKSYPSLLRSDIEVTLVARVSGFLKSATSNLVKWSSRATVCIPSSRTCTRPR